MSNIVSLTVSIRIPPMLFPQIGYTPLAQQAWLIRQGLWPGGEILHSHIDPVTGATILDIEVPVAQPDLAPL